MTENYLSLVHDLLPHHAYRSGVYLVLNPDLTIVGASDGYLRATLLWRKDIIGCQMFAVFPDNPHNPGADGVRNLQRSFQQVLQTGIEHRMEIQRYDVRDFVSRRGEWTEKSWAPVNVPVFGSGSREITHLIHHVQDVTEAVTLQICIIEQSIVIEEQRASLKQMLKDLRRRRRQLERADKDLAELMTMQHARSDLVDELHSRLRFPPPRRVYWEPGRRAPQSGLYEAFHQKLCRFAPTVMYVKEGWSFPGCALCNDSVLYQLRQS